MGREQFPYHSYIYKKAIFRYKSNRHPRKSTLCKQVTGYNE